MAFSDEINSHTVPTSFFTAFITKNNFTVNDINKFTTYTTEERRDFIATWAYSNVINIVRVRELLHGFNLSYDTFIDEYAEYLKGINF